MVEIRKEKFLKNQLFEVWRFWCPRPSVMRDRGRWVKEGIYTAEEIIEEWWHPPLLCKNKEHLEKRKKVLCTCGMYLMYPIGTSE